MYALAQACSGKHRLWACLVENPTNPANPALFFQLLGQSSIHGLVAPSDTKALLTENFPTLQPGAITDAAYDCYTQLFQQAWLLLGCASSTDWVTPSQTWVFQQ